MEQKQLHSIAEQVFEAMTRESWSGQTAEEIEPKIQQLMGQVAEELMQEFVLPARIAQIQEEVESGQQRCGKCQSAYQRHKGNEVIHPQTIFGGTVAVSRDQYYCPRCEEYVMVADEVLGLIEQRMTPRLALVVELCGSSWPYEVASAFLLFLLGVKVAPQTVRNVTTDRRRAPAPLASDPLDQPPGVVTMDGVLIRGRKQDHWLEMKVGSFFSQVVAVNPQRNEALDASFVAGAMSEWNEFIEPVRREARRRGLSHTDAVEFVADGGAGIWDLQQWVFPCARPRLDQYHTKGKIGRNSRRERTGKMKENAEWADPRCLFKSSLARRGEATGAGLREVCLCGLR